MTDALEIRLIDVITAHCESDASLPAHQTVKYTRPVVVLPDDCPLLCVWLVAKESAPYTTDNDDSKISIGVSWQVEAVDRAETLMEDPKRSKETISAVFRLQAALRDIFQRGWLAATGTDIPEAYDGALVNVDYTPPTSLETGLVEGYALTVRVLCQERR